MEIIEIKLFIFFFCCFERVGFGFYVCGFEVLRFILVIFFWEEIRYFRLRRFEFRLLFVVVFFLCWSRVFFLLVRI